MTMRRLIPWLILAIILTASCTRRIEAVTAPTAPGARSAHRTDAPHRTAEPVDSAAAARLDSMGHRLPAMRLTESDLTIDAASWITLHWRLTTIKPI